MECSGDAGAELKSGVDDIWIQMCGERALSRNQRDYGLDDLMFTAAFITFMMKVFNSDTLHTPGVLNRA